MFKIDDIKLEKNMLVLSGERILRNIILLKGSVGNYIFYKTPEQIEEIQKLCQDKNIDFKNEFLYFDMDYLGENIEFIDKAYVERQEELKVNEGDVAKIINILKKRAEELREIEKLKVENQKLNKYLYNQEITTQIDGNKTDKIRNIYKTNFFCDYQKKNNSNKKQV